MNKKILLIEDDTILANTLKDFFEEEGFEVILVDDGNDALKSYLHHHPDLILSDVALPGKSGLEVIAEIRKTDTEIPVILMTGSELDENSQVRGYELGAVNYLPKPVMPQVVLAQINSLLAKLPVYKLGEHTVSIESQLLIIDDKQILLREKDSIIFSILLKNKDRIIERRNILLTVWGNDLLEQSNLLDKSISRLKKELKDFPAIQIKSVYATGYILSGK